MSAAPFVKESFDKLLEKSKDLQIGVISSWAYEKATGETPFQQLANQYMDHCAVVPEPMDFLQFFYNSTLYEGKGSWVVFQAMQTDMGSPPENRDTYIMLRRLARTSPYMKKKAEFVLSDVKALINAVKSPEKSIEDIANQM